MRSDYACCIIIYSPGEILIEVFIYYYLEFSLKDDFFLFTFMHFIGREVIFVKSSKPISPVRDIIFIIFDRSI